jgi:hypothetical protein
MTDIGIHQISGIIVKYDDYPVTNHGPSFTSLRLAISTVDSEQPHVINLYLPAGTRLPNIQETPCT